MNNNNNNSDDDARAFLLNISQCVISSKGSGPSDYLPCIQILGSIPAAVTVVGRDCLLNLRAAIDFALDAEGSGTLTGT